MPVSTVALSLIKRDPSIQPRVSLNVEAIADYAAVYKSDPDSMPEPTACFDGEFYWVYSGFHRLDSAEIASMKSVPILWEEGTREDAAWKALSENARHGVRRTRDDLKRTVQLALAHAKSKRLSSRAIGKHCNVSHSFVEQVRKELAPPVAEKRIATRNGKQYEIAVKPVPKQPKPATPAPSSENMHMREETPQDVEDRVLTLESQLETPLPKAVGQAWVAYAAALETLTATATVAFTAWRKFVESAPARVKQDPHFLNLCSHANDLRAIATLATNAKPRKLCPSCEGKDNECDNCHGTGWLPMKE